MTRVEPRTGKVLPPIRVGNGPSALAVGEGAVWVVNRHDGTLSRIDPATNQVTWTGRIGSDPTAVAVGAGSVWVAGGEEGLVRRVEPGGTHAVVKIEARSSPAAIAVAGGSVWTAADAPLAAHRGGRCAPSCRTRRDAGPDRLVALRWVPRRAAAQLAGLRRPRRLPSRRGPRRRTLVGALATNAPAPSDAGRTYVFTLRRGLRFSDGTPVRPDRRAGLHRARPCRPHGTSLRRSSCRLLRGHRRRPEVHAPGRCPATSRAGSRPTSARARSPSTSLVPTRTSCTSSRRLRVRRARRQRSARHHGADASGHRSLSRRHLGCEARRGARPQPVLPARPRRALRRRLRGPDRRRHLQRGGDRAADRRGPARRRRRDGRREPVLHHALAEPHPLAGRAVAGPAPQQSVAGHELDVPQRAAAAVRRRPRAAGGEPRDRPEPGGRSHRRSGGRRAHLPVPAAGLPGLRALLPLHRGRRAGRGWTAPDMERARRLVAASGRAGERVSST